MAKGIFGAIGFGETKTVALIAQDEKIY